MNDEFYIRQIERLAYEVGCLQGSIKAAIEHLEKGHREAVLEVLKTTTERASKSAELRYFPTEGEAN